MRLEYKKYAVMAALVWVGSAVLLGAVYLFGMSGRIAECRAVREQLASKEKERNVAVEAMLKKNRGVVDEQLEQLRRDLNVYVAENEQAANLTFEIARLAKDGKISSPVVKDRDKGGDKSVLKDCELISEEQYSVSFKSEFPQFARMLHSLESHHPVMFVQKFSILPPTGNETLKDVKLDVSVLARQRVDG